MSTLGWLTLTVLVNQVRRTSRSGEASCFRVVDFILTVGFASAGKTMGTFFVNKLSCVGTQARYLWQTVSMLRAVLVLCQQTVVVPLIAREWNTYRHVFIRDEPHHTRHVQTLKRNLSSKCFTPSWKTCIIEFMFLSASASVTSSFVENAR